MKIEDNILSIAANYETIFVDVYGVLFDGVYLYDQTLATLSKLKKNGKKIVILSNTSQVSSEAIAGYSRRGILPKVHYDEFVTSGEFLHHMIKNHPDKFTQIMGRKSESVKCLFIGNGSIFNETNISQTDVADADFIYIGIPQASYGSVRMDDVWDSDGHKINLEDVLEKDWNDLQDSQGRKGFSEFANQLKNCHNLKKTLLLANPDVFAQVSLEYSDKHMAIATQGTIGAYYEILGGKVVRFGKPYTGIFEYAKGLIDSPGSILMVGDTPWTDVSGANACGFDSALVITTGVASEFLKKMNNNLSLDEKFKILFDRIAIKMPKANGSFTPTHFLIRFADVG
ncbi:MAG: HAD hydrolase-like protein [Holosporaceae bacterium]|nr:HAD hydrolase-like protein [Holosporaceae bacterium]